MILANQAYSAKFITKILYRIRKKLLGIPVLPKIPVLPYKKWSNEKIIPVYPKIPIYPSPV